MRYWNGYQYVERAEPLEQSVFSGRDEGKVVAGLRLVEDESIPPGTVELRQNGEVVGKIVNVGLDRLQMSQLEAQELIVTPSTTPGEARATFSCEVDPCDHVASHRVGDAVNVCADHVDTVIEEGDQVVAL